MAWNTHNIKQFTTQRYQLQMGQYQSNPLQNIVWKSRHANQSRKVVCSFISFNIFYAVMKTSFRLAEVNNLTWAWHKKPHQMSAKKKCQFNGPICWARVNEFYFYSFRGKISIYRRKSMKNISWKYHRRRCFSFEFSLHQIIVVYWQNIPGPFSIQNDAVFLCFTTLILLSSWKTKTPI